MTFDHPGGLKTGFLAESDGLHHVGRGEPRSKCYSQRFHLTRRYRLIPARYASASDNGTTSPYLLSMSKRLASCGSCARSPTASSGTIGRKPCASASITVARTHPLVVQPVTTTVSTPRETSVGASGVPRNAEAYF